MSGSSAAKISRITAPRAGSERYRIVIARSAQRLGGEREDAKWRRRLRQDAAPHGDAFGHAGEAMPGQEADKARLGRRVHAEEPPLALYEEEAQQVLGARLVGGDHGAGHLAAAEGAQGRVPGHLACAFQYREAAERGQALQQWAA